jgi:hypothetical protein
MPGGVVKTRLGHVAAGDWFGYAERLALLGSRFLGGTHPSDVVLSLFAILPLRSTANPLPETLLAPRTHTDKFSAAPCAVCPAHGRNRDDGVYKSETKQKCNWITQRKRDIGFQGTSSLRQGNKQALTRRSGCAVCHRGHERKAGSEPSILHSVILSSPAYCTRTSTYVNTRGEENVPTSGSFTRSQQWD